MVLALTTPDFLLSSELFRIWGPRCPIVEDRGRSGTNAAGKGTRTPYLVCFVCCSGGRKGRKSGLRRSALAQPQTLIPGNCYFSVGSYDNDLVMPMIDTLVYVGQNDDPDHGRMWLFKEPDPPHSSEQDGASDDGPPLIAFSDKQLHEIVDFSGLIQR